MILRRIDDSFQRKQMIKSLDILCAKKVKERDRYKCQWPGCRYRQALNWCHFKSRRYFAVRWEMDNTVTLCVGHHRYTEANPDEFAEFMQKRLGKQKYDAMVLRSKNRLKTDIHNLRLVAQTLKGSL